MRCTCLRCISEWLWRKFGEDGRAVTHLIEVKQSAAGETKEEGLRRTQSEEGEGCWRGQLEGGLAANLKLTIGYQTRNKQDPQFQPSVQVPCFNLPFILSQKNRFIAIKWCFAFSYR